MNPKIMMVGIIALVACATLFLLEKTTPKNEKVQVYLSLPIHMNGCACKAFYC
ncbi:MAG: hypothetical protein QME50_02650 [Candidatus Bathyarchaeota archaeon]|nr:hypothetical protein [Candidatus Bathyarchaeota archaeon]